MPLHELAEELFGGTGHTGVGLRQTLADRGQILKPPEPFHERLIRLRTLKHQLRPAVNRQHFGAGALLQPRYVLLVVAKEVRERMDLWSVDHGEFARWIIV